MYVKYLSIILPKPPLSSSPEDGFPDDPFLDDGYDFCVELDDAKR
jgi:hypothetical protein